jgi:hypothetical protein
LDQAARPRPEKPRASSPPTTPKAPSIFSTYSPSQSKSLLYFPIVRARDLLSIRVGLTSPALLTNAATLASGDEQAMNFVPFRALFLANFREFIFHALR